MIRFENYVNLPGLNSLAAFTAHDRLNPMRDNVAGLLIVAFIWIFFLIGCYWESREP